MDPQRLLCIMVAATGLLGGATPPAYAQVLEEVIVTAQKREQNVQDVPISVSAFSAGMLQERAIGDISGLASIAPNTILDGGTPFSGSSAVQRLPAESRLASGWTVLEAADWFWAQIHPDVWQLLVVERGWMREALTVRVLESLRATLLR